jgi:hypothetical protein
MKKLIIIILVIICFAACEFPSSDTLPTKQKNISGSEIDWDNFLDNFEVHKVYFTSIYSYPDYGADGSYFMADGWVYVQDGFLTRMRPDGSKKKILPAEVNKFRLHSATYHDGWIYFIGDRYLYLDKAPPPGTNEHLLRMRPDGTGLQECVKDVFKFKIHGDWIIYQSGYSLYTVKIGKWKKTYDLYTNNGGTPETWNILNGETWIIRDNYIFYSISETFNGPGQYSTKMYRMDLDGTNKILLIEDPSIIYAPRFMYDGFLYFSGYQSGVRDILYRMDPDGANIITIIKPEIRTPDRSQFWTIRGIRENWLYYENSQIDIPYELIKTTRKVRLDGTDDREVDMSIFGGINENEHVDIWLLNGDFVIWQTNSWVTAGGKSTTKRRMFIAPANRMEDAIEIFDDNGWEIPMSYYIWNGNIYIFVKP